jgi:hypothetical protein
MSSSKCAVFVFVAVAALPVTGEAQGTLPGAAAPAGMRDPGDPRAIVPPAAYVSAFRRYRPNADVEVGAWRDLNDNVGRIGGWRVYGREASADPVAPGKPTANGKAEEPSPAPARAQGHKH